MNVVEIIESAWDAAAQSLGVDTDSEAPYSYEPETGLRYDWLPPHSLLLTNEHVTGADYVALVYTDQTASPAQGVRQRGARNAEDFLFDVRLSQDYLLARRVMQRFKAKLEAMNGKMSNWAPLPGDYNLELLAATGQIFGVRRVATATIHGLVY